MGATQGPDLTLNYQPNQKCRFGIGGRYEKLLFRLDEDGRIADGIGKDSSVPLFLNGTYNFNPKTSISFVGGVELDGELKLEDSDGNTVTEESYETAIFMGLTFNARF